MRVGSISMADLLGVRARPQSRSYSEPSSLMDLLQRPEWHSRAACRGQDVSWWYPTRGTRSPSTSAARALCRACPVKVECLDYASSHHEYGIWANTSERQRKHSRREVAA